jgi:hypothetical protein
MQDWIRSERSLTKQRVHKSDQYFEALSADKLCSCSSQVLRSATKHKSLLSRKHLTSTPMEAAYCKHPRWSAVRVIVGKVAELRTDIPRSSRSTLGGGRDLSPFCTVQTDCVAYPASYSVRSRISFRGGKATGSLSWPLTYNWYQWKQDTQF